MVWQPPASDFEWQPPESDFAGEAVTPSRELSARDYVSSFARPTLETAGMIGGALLGAGAGIPTGPGAIAIGVGGAGLGYAAGRQAANILDESLGVRQTPPLGQQMQDTASDVAAGATGQMIGMASGPVLTGVAKALKPRFPTRMVSTALGPSTDAIEARLADPAKISGAPSYIQQAERLPSTLDIIKGKITESVKGAKSMLRTSTDPAQGAISKSRVQSILDDLQSKIQIKGGVVGQAEKGASSTLESLRRDIGEILKPPKPSIESAGIVGPNGNPIRIPETETYIPEADVKRLIQAIEKNINWQDKAASSTNSYLTDVRGQLDKMLKTQNPEYAKAMKPVSKLQRLYEDAKDSFSITNRTGEGLAPTDATISKIQSLPQDRKAMTQGVARRLKAVTGEDLIEGSKTYGLARQFQSGQTQGSRRVNLGAMVGGVVGSAIGGWGGAAVGGAVGGSTGAYLDKFGGQIAGRLIDRYTASSISRIPAIQAGPATRSVIAAYVARRESAEGSAR